MYNLQAENIVNAGAPMGQQHTWMMFSKFFKTHGDAVKAAEKHYNQEMQRVPPDEREQIMWIDESSNYTRSQDLGWVMYHITLIRPED